MKLLRSERARPHGHEAVEAACERATEIGALSYSSVKSILKTNLHRRRPRETVEGPAITHPNIRRSRGAPTILSGPPAAGRAKDFH